MEITDLKLEAFNSGVFLLTWKTPSASRQKLLTRDLAIKVVNSNKTPEPIRDFLVECFKSGRIL